MPFRSHVPDPVEYTRVKTVHLIMPSGDSEGHIVDIYCMVQQFVGGVVGGACKWISHPHLL